MYFFKLYNSCRASGRLSMSCQKSIPETNIFPLPTLASNNKAKGRLVNQSSMTRTMAHGIPPLVVAVIFCGEFTKSRMCGIA